MPGDRTKVFVVGWHRTGTTSMHVALNALGYRVRDFNGRLLWMFMRTGQARHVVRAARRGDAFRDYPWSLAYRELDAAFPDSRFILTLRDETSWLASYTRLHDRAHPRTIEWLYGPGPGPASDPDRYLERYRAHNRDVIEHFRTRPNLLTFNAFEGDGWDPLCDFLERERPSISYPDEKSATLAGRQPWGRGRFRRS